MSALFDHNPLKSIAIPNVGRLRPNGLTLIIGPNSAGKTQLLKDIHSQMLGQPRRLVVCDDVELVRPESLESLLDVLYAENLIRKRVDPLNNLKIESLVPAYDGKGEHWSLHDHQVQSYFSRVVTVGATPGEEVSDKFLEHFGRWFVTALFLDRRLTITNTVSHFDYETQTPSNELQSLYLDTKSKKVLNEEAQKVFGKSIWLDNSRGGHLCLRVCDNNEMPSADDRLEPEKMKKFRQIEEEGDGFKSYMAICLTLLLGRRPVILIDEPEMCLHPPQAYALGQFIGKHGISTDHMTFVATHSSHVMRGIIEKSTRLEVVRLSRLDSHFKGHKISNEVLRTSIQKPSTKAENVLDGLFAEAVTIVESEGDRLVYGTTWERIASEFQHDVHFVSVGGLGGIADPCSLYMQLKIPVCVAVDLDVIREIGTLEQILKAVASDEIVEELIRNCRSIIDLVKAEGPLFSEEEARQQLTEILDETFNWTNETQIKTIREKLIKLSSGLSQSALLKQGIEQIQNSNIRHDLNAFLNCCRSYGVFLVPVGELEDWLPELMANGPSKRKKAEWANFAAKQIRDAEPQQNDVWDYVRKMAIFQRDAQVRLAGYPSS